MKKLSRGEKDKIAITGMFVLLQEEGLTTEKKKGRRVDLLGT